MVPCRIAIQNLFLQDSRPQTPREVIDALRTTFPGEWTDGMSVFKTYGPLREEFFKTFPPLS